MGRSDAEDMSGLGETRPMKSKRAKGHAAAALLAAALALVGCADPFGAGTDAIGPTPLVATNAARIDPREVAIAEREHPKILASFGGTYEDREAEIAIARAVGRLVAASDEPWRSYRVTLLNSPAVNAFALPGGYVYVTRGLLALANDTSEVAAVIAHEMAHVTARHAFSRAERAEAAAVASRVVQNVVDDPNVQRVALASSQLSLARFSQIQELEADTLGIRMLVRAGYDPYSAARFLTSMARYAAWKTALPADGDASADFLSSHPSTPERISQAVAAAGATGVPGGDRDRDAFLRHVNGLMFGDDPVEGYVRGREFLHAKLGLGFLVPEGFQIENTARAVLATDASGIALRFDAADVKKGGDLVGYLNSGWINGLIPDSVQTVTLNGLPAAVASAEARGYRYRVAVIRFGEQAFRFLFATKTPGARFDRTFQQTIATFRALSPDEQSGLKPLQLQVITVQPGDTVETLGRRMPMLDRPAVLFRVLNGLGPRDQVSVGDKVKIVSG
jgi:predicted Zn-dependent protease